MTEQLIREIAAEKERSRDTLALLDRIASGEKNFAVLLVRFEAAIKAGRTQDDLDNLKNEMEEHVAKQLDHVCDHFSKELERREESFDTKLNAGLRNVVRKLDEGNRRRTDRIIKFGVAFAIILIPLVSGGGSEISKALFRVWTGLP